jgi:hypothetical protein
MNTKATTKIEEDAAADYAGLSATDCCRDCNVDNCVISGMNVCAHPFKGGLPHVLKSNRAALARHQAARRLLVADGADKRSDRRDASENGTA